MQLHAEAFERALDLIHDSPLSGRQPIGLDPLYVAKKDVNIALNALRRSAAGIGEVVDEHPGVLMMKTRVGGTRVVDMLSVEQLPRIC